MIFTDENLKRLKEDEMSFQLMALIQRLEAAERVVEAHSKLEKEKIKYDQFVTLLNSWRKVAGK